MPSIISTAIIVHSTTRSNTLRYYLVQHPVELISGLNNTLSVVAVYNKNEALGVLEVVPPQGPDL